MSTRIQLSAFSLDDIKTRLGSKNADLQNLAIERFEEYGEEIDLDEKEVSDGIERIKNIFTNGAGAKEESLPEITAVQIAFENSSASLLDDFDLELPYAVLDDIQAQFGKRFDGAEQKMLDYFLLGRPLIGETFDGESGFYLYLTNAEVKKLRSAAEKVFKTVAEIVDSGALNEQDFESGAVAYLENLIEALDTVLAEGKDLLAIAS